MAEQDEVPTPEAVAPTPAAPQVIYLNGVPNPKGEVDPTLLSNTQSPNSIFQLKVDPNNPNRAEATHVPGADAQLINGYHATMRPMFVLDGAPTGGEGFVHTTKPAIFERQGESWKMTAQGEAGFAYRPQGPEGLNYRIPIPDTKPFENVPTMAPPVAALVPAATAPRAEGDTTSAKEAAAPAEAEQQSAAGELQIKWRQQGEGVAPLLEMRAYLDQLKDSGVAVGPMKFDRGADGKLSGSFGVSYDPASPDLTKLEGTIQGLKRVGNGVEVVDTPEQVVARRRSIGVDGQDQATDLGYSVKEAFGVKQWDALSAQLSQAPKQALTGPEQVQQEAGIERVGQVAKQQGITKEEVIQEGKSLLDVDTSGNPVSAFLKNFYAQLNGAPKTRQSLEVDYDKTRQELQLRLTKLAGDAKPSDQLKQAPPTEQVAAAVTPAAGVAPAVIETPAPAAPSVAATAAAPAQAPKFTEADIPQKVLATMGLTVADLKASGQMEKLLNGEKTDLLAMQASGKEGQEPVKFDAKMVLHREANGSATLKMELPKRQLEIPNEIGGQPFTPEQRKRLETEGTAGLVRGLKDEKGNTYNGYVGIDKEMNKVVVLPENKVSIKDTIAGVKLTPEQSNDLREGKAVALSNMAQGDGGKPYDGTAQIVASKASIVVKPTPKQPMQKQTTAVAQSTTQTVKTEVPTVEAPKPKVRGPRL